MTLKSPLKTKLSLRPDIVIKKSGPGGYEMTVRANGADLFIGALVTVYGESASDPDVDLTASGEITTGVITGPAVDALNLDNDSDDAYADNTMLKCYIWARGDQILLCGKTNSTLAITKGAGGYALAGFIQDATVGTHHILCQFLEAEAAGTTQEVYVLALMF